MMVEAFDKIDSDETNPTLSLSTQAIWRTTPTWRTWPKHSEWSTFCRLHWRPRSGA